MTALYMTSKYNSLSSKNYYRFDKIYQVEIQDEDGESFDFEVTAEDYSDAARKAEDLAYSEGINIGFINIYEY